MRAAHACGHTAAVRSMQRGIVIAKAGWQRCSIVDSAHGSPGTRTRVSATSLLVGRAAGAQGDVVAAWAQALPCPQQAGPPPSDPCSTTCHVQALSPSSGLRERLEAAVFDVGMLAIDGWQGEQQPANSPAAALADYARCAQDGQLYSQLNQVVLGDGSIRT